MSIEQQEAAFDQRLAEMGIRIKDANNLKVSENVFDEVTLLALYKLVHKKWLTAIGGSISTGKEANVFLGEREDASVAIKIYRIQSANFTTMSSVHHRGPPVLPCKKVQKGACLCLDKKRVL